MSIMRCSHCGRYGIYWKGLESLSPWTYCPHCEGINCQVPEEQEELEEYDGEDPEGEVPPLDGTEV